jgi:hypothetical protein
VNRDLDKAIHDVMAYLDSEVEFLELLASAGSATHPMGTAEKQVVMVGEIRDALLKAYDEQKAEERRAPTA